MMLERRPDLMQHKVDLKRVIDLSKISIGRVRALFGKEKNKENRKAISGHIRLRHTGHAQHMVDIIKKKKTQRRNELAKRSGRINR